MSSTKKGTSTVDKKLDLLTHVPRPEIGDIGRFRDQDKAPKANKGDGNSSPKSGDIKNVTPSSAPTSNPFQEESQDGSFSHHENLHFFGGNIPVFQFDCQPESFPLASELLPNYLRTNQLKPPCQTSGYDLAEHLLFDPVNDSAVVMDILTGNATTTSSHQQQIAFPKFDKEIEVFGFNVFGAE